MIRFRVIVLFVCGALPKINNTNRINPIWIPIFETKQRERERNREKERERNTDIIHSHFVPMEPPRAENIFAVPNRLSSNKNILQILAHAKGGPPPT